MGTEIRFVEGTPVRVVDEYRDVYAKLLAANWQMPCEFVLTGDEHHQITIMPAYVMSFQAG
jgi:hypothetical protein